MPHRASLVVVAVLALAGVDAHAQPADGAMAREGFIVGFGVGLGRMSADSGPIRCDDCEHPRLAGGFDVHVGGRMSPRAALVFELSGTGQGIDRAEARMLSQFMILGTVQYWVVPRLWLKGGVGSSHLRVSFADDGERVHESLDNGIGALAALGVELVHSHPYALDLQLRLAMGAYQRVDERLGSAVLGLGFDFR